MIKKPRIDTTYKDYHQRYYNNKRKQGYKSYSVFAPIECINAVKQFVKEFKAGK